MPPKRPSPDFTTAWHTSFLAAGVDPAPWRSLGLSLGEAYQMADDIRDVAASIESLGKPTGRGARTAAQLSALLHEAGFVQVRERPTAIPLQVGVIVARKPGRANG